MDAESSGLPDSAGDVRLKLAYPQKTQPEEIFHHSIAGAILHIWLAAATFGLSTTSASTFSFHQQKLKEGFGIPDNYHIPCTSPIGYPVTYQETRYRKEVKEFVHYGRYDQSAG